MPSIPFTDAEREAIRDLGNRLRDDERDTWASGFHITTLYAVSELTLAGTLVEHWETAFKELLELAATLDCAVIYDPRNVRNFHDAAWTRAVRVPYKLGLVKSGTGPNGFVRYVPSDCNCEFSVLPVRCECGTLRGCGFCGATAQFNPGVDLAEDADGTVACDSCRGQCTWDGCERFVYRAEIERCDEHSGSEFGLLSCNYCGYGGYENSERTSWHEDVNGNHWCAGCWENRPSCADCGRTEDAVALRGVGNPDADYDEYATFQCEDCASAERAMYAEKIAFDYSSPVTAEMLAVPALPDRPPRAVSVEQEMTIKMGDADALGYTLHDLGLSPYNCVEGYHSSGHTGFVHLETDSSIAGCELIYNRVDFSQPEEQERAAQVIEAVAGAGSTFDATCGTHFHVDAHGCTVRDAKNLVILYSSLEDLIFRVAGAGYDAHRSQLRKGRVYAKSIQKQEWRDARHFGRDFLRAAAHDDSLNLQHYYQSMRHCECGAIEFGQQSECDCNLGKHTFEWRVFNGTNDPRKLRAWLALSQACVAWAQDRELRYADYRPLSYGQPHDRATAELRMRFMLTKLPMTEDERTDLAWCFQNTDLAHEFTDGEIEGMIGEYIPERELPLAPEFGFRSSGTSAQARRERMLSYAMSNTATVEGVEATFSAPTLEPQFIAYDDNDREEF